MDGYAISFARLDARQIHAPNDLMFFAKLPFSWA